MYRPKQVGILAKARNKVVYEERDPANDLQKFYFCTWELRTTDVLTEEFSYLILPDVCTDIIFDLHSTNQADSVFIMASGNGVEKVNLGKQFHYVGLRFLPGVLQAGVLEERQVVQQTWQHLKQAVSTEERRDVLVSFVRSLLAQNKIAENYLMYRILSCSDQLRRVSDIERLSGYTRRQLQRIFRTQTGLTPSEFLKVLRFQDTLEGPDHPYADQSHLVKEYRRITGLTPRAFRDKY